MFWEIRRPRTGTRHSVHLAIVLLAAVMFAHVPCSPAATNTIASIEVRGLKRMTKDAFLFASGLKVGQSCDDSVLRDAFRRLWDRKLFSDLKIDVEDAETGKDVIFTVTERPLLVSIDYDTV